MKAGTTNRQIGRTKFAELGPKWSKKHTELGEKERKETDNKHIGETGKFSMAK